MNVFQQNKNFTGFRIAFCGTLAAGTLWLASTGTANSQTPQNSFIDFSHPNITVDLSVINDGGYQPSVSTAVPSLGAPSGRKLLVPGGQAPSSALHLPTVSGDPLPKLTKPKKKVAVAKAPEAKKEPAPVVAKAPVETAPPAPAEVPAPKQVEVVETPKKLEAPVKPETEVAKVEESAPPPAPVVKPAPKVTKTEAPTPPPAPEAKKTPAEEQAALPPSGAESDTGALRVIFVADQTKLPAAAKDSLLALAKQMKGQDNMRLQLMAYAGGPSLSSSLARRMSLSRALSVRSFLIESGVRSTRIDVRALGNKTTEEPVNRVDLNIAER